MRTDTPLHYELTGPEDAPVVVFAHALGTDLRLWDAILPLLPQGLRVLRYDLRGHGQSPVPQGPYSMGALIADIEGLMDQLGLRDAVFVGLSLGGMIAQGLAAKRLDLVRALVLSNTAAKIGTRDIWHRRIAQVNQGGMEAICDETLTRWFPRSFRTDPAHDLWRARLQSCSPIGWTSCANAIAGTDFISSTSGLRLAALGIAGGHDGSTPPDLVRETLDLIPGSEVQLIRKAGHLPCVDAPEEYARILSDFLSAQGHIAQ
jgi:3-oxoadipate enol-lactonase